MTRSCRWAIVCACVAVAGIATGFVVRLGTSALPSQLKSELASVHGVKESERRATVVTLKLKRAGTGPRDGGFAVSSAGLDLNYLYCAASRQSFFLRPGRKGRETNRDVARRPMVPGGGYVAGASHDYILEETPVENVVAIFDAVRDFRLG